MAFYSPLKPGPAVISRDLSQTQRYEGRVFRVSSSSSEEITEEAENLFSYESINNAGSRRHREEGVRGGNRGLFKIEVNNSDESDEELRYTPQVGAHRSREFLLGSSFSIDQVAIV